MAKEIEKQIEALYKYRNGKKREKAQIAIHDYITAKLLDIENIQKEIINLEEELDGGIQQDIFDIYNEPSIMLGELIGNRKVYNFYQDEIDIELIQLENKKQKNRKDLLDFINKIGIFRKGE